MYNKSKVETLIQEYAVLYSTAMLIAEKILCLQKFHFSVSVYEVEINQDWINVQCSGYARGDFMEQFSFPTHYIYSENYFEQEKIRQEQITKDKLSAKQKEQEEINRIKEQRDLNEFQRLKEKYESMNY